MKKQVPHCPQCGYEFKLLTALGLKKVKGLYCVPCTIMRGSLQEKVSKWNALIGEV
jgi:hypothetical protein